MKYIYFLFIPFLIWSQAPADFTMNDAFTKWAFDPAQGTTTVNDSVNSWVDFINSNDVVQNDLTARPKLNNTYLTFDADATLNIASPSTNFNIPTTSFTITARVSKANAAVTGYICGKYINSANSWTFGITGNDVFLNIFEASVFTNQFVTTSDYISNSTIYTLTIVVDYTNNSGYLYIDGSPVTLSTNTINSNELTGAAAFGIAERGNEAFGWLIGDIYWLQWDDTARDATWASNAHNYLIGNISTDDGQDKGYKENPKYKMFKDNK